MDEEGKCEGYDDPREKSGEWLGLLHLGEGRR